MGWKSTPDKYGRMAIAIHWTSAIAIIGLLASGFQAADMGDPASKAGLLRIHAILGTSVLILTLLRIAWWRFADRRPDDIPGPRLQTAASRIVHVLFYVVILGMGASGIGMIALSGAGPILFSGSAAPLPDFTLFAPRIPHGLGGRLMVALLLVHTAAALYHHFALRDHMLARMGLGSR